MKKITIIFWLIFGILTVNADKFISETILSSFLGALLVILLISGVITGLMFLVKEEVLAQIGPNIRKRRRGKCSKI